MTIEEQRERAYGVRLSTVEDQVNVLNPEGRLMAAWPTDAEARAWVAGVAYGAEVALQAIDLADADTRSRMEGLRRIVSRFIADTKVASLSQ